MYFHTINMQYFEDGNPINDASSEILNLFNIYQGYLFKTDTRPNIWSLYIQNIWSTPEHVKG